jgi:isopentenyl diphosphate isomerase/L-lactate dehydrogenase-like FMN-dependent dehydrogenase/biotin carboxylase
MQLSNKANTKNKSIIVIGGGNLQLPMIRTAQNDLNLNVIVFDQNPESPGSIAADLFSKVSTIDADSAVSRSLELQKDLADTTPIHGVITAGTDMSYTVANVAEALGLPGIFPENAKAASDKLIMRNRLFECAVPIPFFTSISSLADLRQHYNSSLPAVLKPTRNMGARGVRLIRSTSELEAAFRHSMSYAKDGTLLLEEFMDGPELSIDSLIWTKIPWKDFINILDKSKFQNSLDYRREIFKDYIEIKMTGIADRIIRHPPYFIEPGHNMPSLQPSSVLEEAERVMKEAIIALGLFTGAAKGDLKVTSRGVKVGEIAARLSGGYMSSHTFPMHSGIALHKNAILIAMAEFPESLEPVKNKTVIERCIPFTLNQDDQDQFKTGKITEFCGLDEILKIPGIEFAEFTRKTGDILPWPTSNVDKAGHIIASADTLEEAEAVIKKASEKLRFETDNTFTYTVKEIESIAKGVLKAEICHLCKICDGRHCASGVPGMGAIGRMQSFKNNGESLNKISIVPDYIHPQVIPDSSINIFGKNLKSPLMPAPMTGTFTNMGGFISEVDFASYLMRGALEFGSIMWFGDGADPYKYKEFLNLIEKSEGRSVIILKPRTDMGEIKKRIKEVTERGALAIGFDIDSIALKTMELKNQATSSRSSDEWKKLRDLANLPFILKGILSQSDAEEAIKIGVDAIVVSNHGGRNLDNLPGAADVLPDISRIINKRIHVFADGGIRSGSDVYKMMALGADAVLIGRPMVTAIAGAKHLGVKRYFHDINEELINIMKICGDADIAAVQVSGAKRLRKI